MTSWSSSARCILPRRNLFQWYHQSWQLYNTRCKAPGEGVPSCSWGTWGSFSSWLVLIHCASTVCWGCQNARNHSFLEMRDGGRVTMAGRSEIVSPVPGRKNKDNWRVQVWSLCLHLMWGLENMRSRQQDRVSDTVRKILSTPTLLAILFGSIEYWECLGKVSSLSSEHEILGWCSIITPKITWTLFTYSLQMKQILVISTPGVDRDFSPKGFLQQRMGTHRQVIQPGCFNMLIWKKSYEMSLTTSVNSGDFIIIWVIEFVKF